MRSRLFSVLTALVLAGPTVLLTAPPAEAHTVQCVSKAEFHSVDRGMAIARVHRIFDTSGRQAWFFGGTQYSPAEQGRHYRACAQWWPGGPHGDAYVDYTRRQGTWRVTLKYAYW